MALVIIFSIPALATHNPSVSHSATAVTNGTFSDNYTFISYAQNATPIIIRGNDTQLANLTVWQTFGGVPLASINATGSWRLGGAATPVLFIDNNTGSVGIGDISPAAMLTVGSGDLFQVNSTGHVQSIAGTVGAPSFSFTSDTNTGIYSGGADILRLVTGGADRITIDASGLVGIRTVAPYRTLQLNGTLETNESVYLATVGNQLAGIGTTAPFAGLMINKTTPALQVNDSVYLAVSGGRVGINTTSPQQTLNVYGTANLTSSSAGSIPLIVQAAPSQTANLQRWLDASGTVLGYVDVSGNLNVTASVFANGQNITGNTGWTDDGTAVRLTTITDSIGIGTIAPLARLHVEGNITVNASAAAQSPLVVRGTASQTGNLTEWRNSSNYVLAYVNESGGLFYRPFSGYATRGLVLLMHLNNETADWSGNGNDGTKLGNTNCNSTMEGMINTGCRFDGSSGNVSAADSGSLTFANREITIELWFNIAKTNQDQAFPALVSKHDNLVREFLVYYDNATKTVTLSLGNNSGSATSNDIQQSSTATVMNDTRWHHIAIAFSNTSAAGAARFYVDGLLDVTRTYTLGGNMLVDTSSGIAIGSNAVSGNSTLNGTIDEVAIWNRALSTDEVRNRYLERKALRGYESGDRIGGNLTVAGNVGIGTSAPYRRLQVNGTGGALEVNDSVYLAVSGGNVGIGTTAPAGLLHLNSSLGAGALRVENTTGASLLFVNGTSGNVGIGTAGPGTILDVRGNITILAGSDIRPTADSTTALNIANATGTDFVIFDTTNSRVGIGGTPLAFDYLSVVAATQSQIGIRSTTADSPTNLLFVSASGASTSSTVGAITWFTGTDSLATLSAVKDGTTDSAYVQISTQPTAGLVTERMRITSAGNLGIGTTSPGSYKLNVAGGVNASSYATNGTDYAEMFGKLYADESIEAGDVVEIVEGKITKSGNLGTGATGIFMVVTDSAGVIGNEGIANGVPVAFIGQVRVKVSGKASAGDYILPSGKGDGTAVAVPKAEMTFEKLMNAIGRAVESSEGTGKVLVAVGIK